MKKIGIALAGILTVLAFTNISENGKAWGAIPRKISYQGVLTNSTGSPVADGTYTLDFRLFTSSTGGMASWYERNANVSVQNGNFSAIVGSVSGLNLAFDKTMFLELTVISGTDLGLTYPTTFPRVELTSAPYAVRADTANSLSLPFAGTVSKNGAAFKVTNTNSLGTAGLFLNDNVSNLSPVVEVASKGSGEALRATTSGTGPAALFQIDAFSNDLPAIESYTYGTGWAAAFSGLGGSSKGVTISAGAGQVELQVESDLFVKAGKVGVGTVFPQGALDVWSTTGALIVPRMTTAQRNALAGMNGMIIYNTTTNQFNFYENGAWVIK